MFQNSDLAHIQYPVMGLLATMLTSVGDTVKAGWGRLGGSVVAGVFAVLIIGTFGMSPLTGGVSFIFASLCCELLGWKALVGQAGVITALIAAEPALGANPGVYAVDRVFDNSIGVFVGTAVTVCFWPERPRAILQNNLIRVSHLSAQGMQAVISGNDRDASQAVLERQTIEINKLAKESEALLNRSLYGFLGRNLVQDNWSDRIALERRLRRHLMAMGRILRPVEPNPLVTVFAAELQRLSLQISEICESVTEVLRQGTGPTVDQATLPTLETHLSAIINRLTEMRRQGENRAYALPDVIQFYDFMGALTRLTQDLDQLALKLIQPEKQTAPARPFWQPRLYKIPTSQIQHYLKVGIALGLTLAIVDFAQLPYGYYVALALVVAMQPTLGKGINAGWQRALGTVVGALVAVVIVNSLGSDPLTVGLGVALTMLICDRLGMNQAGYKGGCFLVTIAIMIHSNEPNSYIWGRFSETLLGLAIALGVYLLFPSETAAQKVDPRLSQTYKQLGQLYQAVMGGYVQAIAASDTTKPLIAEIRQAIQTQESLQADSKLELIENFKAAPLQRSWNFLHSYQRTLLTNILTLKHVVTQADSGVIMALFPEEFATLQTSIGLAFEELARAVDTQPNAQRFTGLEMPLNAIQQKLEQARSSGLTSQYDLSQAISFFGVLAALREIVENLEQMLKDWPQRQPGLL